MRKINNNKSSLEGLEAGKVLKVKKSAETEKFGNFRRKNSKEGNEFESDFNSKKIIQNPIHFRIYGEF